MKTLVIIPAYNEEDSISRVISSITDSVSNVDIVVINDGSKDHTAVQASRAGATVISLPFNLGIGGAVQTGFVYARQLGYDIAVQVDGDGQHDPGYISRLIEPIKNGSTDMVIGSRYISKTAYQSSFLRRTGMLFFSSLISLLTGQQIKDTTSGFRAINKNVINYFSEHYPSDYPEVDVLVKLHRRHFRIMELPVEMKKRQGGKSSITPVRSIYYMFKVSLCLLIGTIRSSEEQGG